MIISCIYPFNVWSALICLGLLPLPTPTLVGCSTMPPILVAHDFGKNLSIRECFPHESSNFFLFGEKNRLKKGKTGRAGKRMNKITHNFRNFFRFLENSISVYINTSIQQSDVGAKASSGRGEGAVLVKWLDNSSRNNQQCPSIPPSIETSAQVAIDYATIQLFRDNIALLSSYIVRFMAKCLTKARNFTHLYR